jgi:hypothetical protein
MSPDLGQSLPAEKTEHRQNYQQNPKRCADFNPNAFFLQHDDSFMAMGFKNKKQQIVFEQSLCQGFVWMVDG